METNQLTESPDTTASAAAEEVTAEPSLDASVEDTGVDASQQASDTPPEPEYDFLDTDELGGKHVRVKVDGEELVVPLSEALSGYSRHEDYTRKTQQAADALRLAQAVQTNPGLTMRALADQVGMSVEEFLNLTPSQQQNAAQQVTPEEAPPTDPIERKLWEQERIITQMQQEREQERADQHLRQAIGGLQQQYGATDEEQMSVVNAAMQMTQRTGRPIGPEFFPMILQSMRWQKAQAQQDAQQQHTAQRQADDAQRQAAAAAANEVVGSGQPSAAGTTPIPADGSYPTLEAAIRASLDQLGVPE